MYPKLTYSHFFQIAINSFHDRIPEFPSMGFGKLHLNLLSTRLTFPRIKSRECTKT